MTGCSHEANSYEWVIMSSVYLPLSEGQKQYNEHLEIMKIQSLSHSLLSSFTLAKALCRGNEEQLMGPLKVFYNFEKNLTSDLPSS